MNKKLTSLKLFKDVLQIALKGAVIAILCEYHAVDRSNHHAFVIFCMSTIVLEITYNPLSSTLKPLGMIFMVGYIISWFMYTRQHESVQDLVYGQALVGLCGPFCIAASLLPYLSSKLVSENSKSSI